MQAGESLSFITVPDELAEAVKLPEKEITDTWEAFSTLVQTALWRHEEHRIAVTLQGEGITQIVEEISLRCNFTDGSYLHIVPFAHRDDEGIAGLGLSLIEHDKEGGYVGGYVYETSPDNEMIMCSRQLDGTEIIQDDDESYHYSVVQMHKDAVELIKSLRSDDPDISSQADLELRKLHEEAELALYERELGFSWTPARLEDVTALQALVAMAKPFSVSSSSGA